MLARSYSIAAWIVFFLAAIAFAQTPGPVWLTLDDDAGTPAPAGLIPANYPTGTWGGLRPALADKGFTFSGYVQLDISKAFAGGIHTDQIPVRYLLDLNATVDTDKLFKWPGGTFFVDFESHDGGNASVQDVGDLQGFDGQDASHFVQIFQLWYQQMLLNNKLRIKGGKIDANTDFAVIEHGKEFLNSSASYPTSMFPFVTYPDPAPGGEVFVQPDAHFYAGIGAFYSNQHQNILNFVGHPQAIELSSGGAFLIGEAGYRWTLAKDSLAGHAAVGGWDDTGKFSKMPSGTADGSGGFYALVDQSFWQAPAADGNSTREIGGFLEWGVADPHVFPIADQLGGGVTFAGIIPFRPNDVLGAGTFWARLGDLPKLNHQDEWASEVFYRLQATRWAYLKPDLQYIVTPGGRYPDALVATLRLEIDF